MKRHFKNLFVSIAILAVALMVLAGCGGGGGGTNPARKSNLQLNIELPRQANSAGGHSFIAAIDVLSYDSAGRGTSVANTTTTLTADDTTQSYTGSFKLTQIPVGSNYIVKVAASYDYGDTASSTARMAAQTSDPFAYVGAIVDEIADGVTASVAVTPKTTVIALATLKYAVGEGVALSDTTTVTAAVKTSISSAVDSLIAAETVDPQSFSYPMSDPFTIANWDTTMVSSLTSVLTTAELIDTTAPTVSSFYPADGATDVPADGAYFKAIFSESMDTTVDLNTAATLSASGFSITIAKSGGATLTINSANALSYGTFSWITITTTNDTLMFTLNANSALTTAGLSTLEAGSTYTISSWTAPTNVTDVAGNAVSTTGIATSGSFTTVASTDTTAPTVSSFYPADAAIDVPYDETLFKVHFNETMDETINMNLAATLSASGFSITIARSGGGTLTINASNALNYGAFEWWTDMYTNDTLAFILHPISTLEASSLSTLQPDSTYTITSWTAPTNLTDAAGNAVSTTGVASGGSFTTASYTGVDTTSPTVLSIDPVDGQSNVDSNRAIFKVNFSETMDASVDLNNSTTLTASGFSITLAKSGGGTLTIDATNALSYGAFAWENSNGGSNNSLSFTLNSSYDLHSSGLSHLEPSSTYSITSRTIPTNLVDFAGNPLDTTGIATTGSFTTSSADQEPPVVVAFDPVDGQTGVAYDGMTLSAIFDETMDNSVDLNDATTLTSSGFSVTIAKSGGGTITIDATNALSYGTFAWTSTSTTNDTLTFTLNSNTSLQASGLSYPICSSTYTITAWTAASNVLDMAGNPIEEASVPTTGSFTTTTCN